MNAIVKSWATNIVLFAVTAGAAVIVGSRLPHWIEDWRGPIRGGDYSLHVDKQPYRLTLYGTSTCPHCAAARDYLRQAGIAFNDVVIDKSKAAEDNFRKLEQNGVPVLVSDKQLVLGFDAKAFNEIIRR